MNPILFFEALIVVLSFLFLLKPVDFKINVKYYFVEDIYASLIALEKLNTTNWTLVCNVIKDIVPDKYNVSIYVNNVVICNETGRIRYKIEYPYFANNMFYNLTIYILE